MTLATSPRRIFTTPAQRKERGRDGRHRAALLGTCRLHSRAGQRLRQALRCACLVPEEGGGCACCMDRRAAAPGYIRRNRLSLPELACENVVVVVAEAQGGYRHDLHVWCWLGCKWLGRDRGGDGSGSTSGAALPRMRCTTSARPLAHTYNGGPRPPPRLACGIAQNRKTLGCCRRDM